LDVNEYKNIVLNVNEDLYKKIKSNILFVRTLDTGKMDGRVGLYEVKEVFNVDGIFVSKSKHRTHPIQIFLEPIISKEHQKLLKNYFNLLLPCLVFHPTGLSPGPPRQKGPNLLTSFSHFPSTSIGLRGEKHRLPGRSVVRATSKTCQRFL